MENGSRTDDFEIKRRGCDKDLFVEVVQGEKLSRQLFMTVSFASKTRAAYSRDPNRFVEFGLKEAWVKVDLGEHAAINLEKPFLSGKFLRSSSITVKAETDDRQSHQASSEMHATVSAKPEIGGKESASDSVSSGEKSSAERTIEQSHIEFISDGDRSELEWHFTAPESKCLGGALPREPLCFVDLEQREDDYFVSSQFKVALDDVVIHGFSDSFREDLDSANTGLAEKSLKKKIARKIAEETCTEQELYRLLDRGEPV